MHGCLDYTININMKSIKETIEIEITLIDNENNYIKKTLVARLPIDEV